jgi:uncharacterized DUF497 family protein
VFYEWDPAKAAENLRKHGVSFMEAASVFLDPLAMTYPDPDHSADEDREITLGFSNKSRIIFVSHCERDTRIRLISARKVTQREKLQYEKKNRQQKN